MIRSIKVLITAKEETERTDRRACSLISRALEVIQSRQGGRRNTFSARAMIAGERLAYVAAIECIFIDVQRGALIVDAQGNMVRGVRRVLRGDRIVCLIISRSVGER